MWAKLESLEVQHGSDLNDLLNTFWQTFRHIDHASTVCNELGLDSMALAVENNQW